MREPERSKPSVRELQEAARRDPDFMIQAAWEMLAETGSPFHAWLAVKTCIDHNRSFPEWLLAYLGQCAERMQSEKAAAEGRDLRKVLPWIFGFPNVFDPTQGKRGPGNLLDPYREEPEGLSLFALRFATRIELGEPVTEAMRNACNEAFDGKDADADEKTLRRRLREFNLKEGPASVEQWKKITREHYSSIFRALEAAYVRVSRDSDVQ
jgi:hypothetical protein